MEVIDTTPEGGGEGGGRSLIHRITLGGEGVRRGGRRRAEHKAALAVIVNSNSKVRYRAGRGAEGGRQCGGAGEGRRSGGAGGGGRKTPRHVNRHIMFRGAALFSSQPPAGYNVWRGTETADAPPPSPPLQVTQVTLQPSKLPPALQTMVR